MLLASAGYAIFLAFRSILALDGEVQAAILTFLGAFTIWLVRSTYEARRDERRRGYEHRRDVYLQLLSTFQGIFGQTRATGSAEPSTDLVEDLRDASNKLYLEASDSVYRAFRGMLRNAQAQEAATDGTDKAAMGMRSIHSLGCFMLEMRKDIGFKKTSLDEQDYLRQLLTDYEEHRDFFEALSCST